MTHNLLPGGTQKVEDMEGVAMTTEDFLAEMEASESKDAKVEKPSQSSEDGDRRERREGGRRGRSEKWLHARVQ